MPERSCVVCRAVRPKGSLLRFVFAEQEGALTIALDVHGTLPGRGCYVCRKSECCSSRKLQSLISSGIKRSARGGKRFEGKRVKEDSMTQILERAFQKCRSNEHQQLSEIRALMEQPVRRGKIRL